MKAYKGSRGTAPLILKPTVLDGGVWLTSLPGRFITGKELGYVLARRLDGPRAGLDVVEKNILALLGFEPRSCPSLVC